MVDQKAASDDARAAMLDAFIKDANSKDPGAVFTEYTNPMKVEVISTGAISLDYVLGVGGVPRGRIVEVYGPEHSGKTSLALSVCANAIKDGSSAGFVDVENAINFDHVRWMGVDTRFFVVAQPDSGEEALQQVESMCESGAFSVVVVDSVAALVPQAELNGEIGDQTMALVGRLMSQALRRLVGVAHRTNTTIIFINQLREKPGVSYGSPEYTPGGRALKYYASVRLDVRSSPSKQIKVGVGVNQRVVGQTTKVTVKKNKVAAPFKSAEYNLMFGEGIDSAGSLLDVAVATEVWTARPGGIFVDTATGESVGRGRDLVADMLRADPVLEARVRTAVTAKMRAAVVAEEIDDDEIDPYIGSAAVPQLLNPQ